MKKIIILTVLLYSFLGYGQEYTLWLSGKGTHDIIIPTSQAPYRSIRRIYYKSLTPPYLVNDEAIRDTGIHDIQSNSSFPLKARYELSYTPNFNGVFETKIGSINLKKFESVFVGCELEEAGKTGFGPSEIRHYTNYNYPVHIFQWAIVLPKYVQPSIINSERTLTDKLFISQENIFTDPVIDVPYVKWQYQTNLTTFFWKDFPPSIQNKFPMNHTIEDILVDEMTPLKDIKTIRVRMVLSPPPSRGYKKNFLGFYEEQDIMMPVVYSEIFKFNIFDASPQLQEPVVTQKTSCNYNKDGSFTLNFNRDLNLGESLAITLYIQNSITGEYDIIADGGQILNISSLQNKSYTWPNPLPADSYVVKYQSHSGSLSGTDASWNSLEPSNPFVIAKAASVDFSATSHSDESCYDTNDGYIEIQATGEASRTYFYQYSIDGGVNYINWLPFSNANKTILSGLGKGNYKIKVKDNKGCLARN
ncbi:hypothetical protein ACQY1Q_02095 [Tenacibaculum sp. TC6]|uniref:hypothetical protein n=1 Tax=Tenacibaculum sp. TC6 TaxID=3423223 RepID=UPI003D36137C